MQPPASLHRLLPLAILPVILVSAHAAVVAEVEGNNLHTSAQFIPTFQFTSEADPNIEQSTEYTHATIAATGDGTVDWFVFYHGGGRLMVDIDGGMPTIDLELGLWDNPGTLIASNDDRGAIDPGSVHGYDSFLDLANLAEGLYYIGVSAYPSGQADSFVIGGSGFTSAGYSLHLSSGLTAVPEPASAALLLLSGLACLRRRRG